MCTGCPNHWIRNKSNIYIYIVRAWASWLIVALYLFNQFFLPYFSVFFWSQTLPVDSLMSLLLCPVCEICVFCHCERVIMFLVGFLPPMLLVSFIFSIVNLVDYLYCSLVKEREGGNLKSPATFMHMRLLFAWILFVWIWRISVSNQHIFLYITYKKEFMLPPPPAFLFYYLFLLLAYIITSFFNCQMLEDHPQIRNGVQLSVVQGYMSNFYRSLKCHWCSHWYSQNDLWHCVYVSCSGGMEHGLLEIQP